MNTSEVSELLLKHYIQYFPHREVLIHDRNLDIHLPHIIGFYIAEDIVAMHADIIRDDLYYESIADYLSSLLCLKVDEIDSVITTTIIDHIYSVDNLLFTQIVYCAQGVLLSLLNRCQSENSAMAALTIINATCNDDLTLTIASILSRNDVRKLLLDSDISIKDDNIIDAWGRIYRYSIEHIDSGGSARCLRSGQIGEENEIVVCLPIE